MIDTNEQLKELFAPFEHIDISKLYAGQCVIDKDHPIYWICVGGDGDLCCGKSTFRAYVDMMLATPVKQIMFFRRRETNEAGNQ